MQSTGPPNNVPPGMENLPAQAGTYVLILSATRKQPLQIGRFALMNVQPGWYYYVGSAFGPGGLRSRVSRHCLKDKKMRWHIDYLRAQLKLESVIYSTFAKKLEKDWVDGLTNHENLSIPLNGFGASDRQGETHLFYSEHKLARKQLIEFLSHACCPQAEVCLFNLPKDQNRSPV